MSVAQQEQEIQTGNRPGSQKYISTKTNTMRQSNHANPTQTSCLYENTTVQAARSAERHGTQVSRNENGHPTQSAIPKITVEANTATPTQLSYKIHLYNSSTQARARAGKRRHWRVTYVQKSSKATTLAYTYMWRHSAQSCETNSYNYSDRCKSAEL